MFHQRNHTPNHLSRRPPPSRGESRRSRQAPKGRNRTTEPDTRLHSSHQRTHAEPPRHPFSPLQGGVPQEPPGSEGEGGASTTVPDAPPPSRPYGPVHLPLKGRNRTTEPDTRLHSSHQRTHAEPPRHPFSPLQGGVPQEPPGSEGEGGCFDHCSRRTPSVPALRAGPPPPEGEEQNDRARHTPPLVPPKNTRRTTSPPVLPPPGGSPAGAARLRRGRGCFDHRLRRVFSQAIQTSTMSRCPTFQHNPGPRHSPAASDRT